MAQPGDARDAYLSEFARFEAEFARDEPSWLRETRRAAIAQFRAKGFPTLKDEEWKYTSVAPIARASFTPAYRDAGDGVSAAELERIEFSAFAGIRLVFVNGRFAPALSTVAALPEGVRAGSLADILASDPESLEPHLGKHARFENHPFTALNTAFLRDGAIVEVSPGIAVEPPIHLLFLSTPRDPPLVSHPRNLFVLREGGQATIIESYAGVREGAYFTNAVTEAVVGPNAVLDHYKVEGEGDTAFHVATLQVRQDRASTVSDTSIAFGGALVRNDVNATFAAEGGGLDLNGLYVTAGQQHVDNHTRIDHVTPHCTSRELYKGILDGRSRGVFYGNIIVHKDAQKTDAMQTNKNLLLSSDALVDSIPGLQILANDVKCRHGSSIGQLDPDSVFYLRSRGLDEEAARSLLTYAFATEVVKRIKVRPLRAAVDAWILSRLPNSEVVREAL